MAKIGGFGLLSSVASGQVSVIQGNRKGQCLLNRGITRLQLYMSSTLKHSFKVVYQITMMKNIITSNIILRMLYHDFYSRGMIKMEALQLYLV